MFADVSNPDDATTQGFYQGSSWTNAPATTGILIMPYYATGYWRFQLFCDNQSTHMWFRSGTSGGYSDWKQIV